MEIVIFFLPYFCKEIHLKNTIASVHERTNPDNLSRTCIIPYLIDTKTLFTRDH